MTLYGFLAALAWALLGGLFLWRVDHFAHRWLSAKRLDPGQEGNVVIPDDLVGLAMNESEKWAQDSVLDTIRERYDKLRDWNKVRRAVGAGEVTT